MVLADDLSEVSAVLLGDVLLDVGDLSRAISVGDSGGAVGTATLNATVVLQRGDLEAEGNVDDALVREEWHRRQRRRLVAAVLRCSRGDHRRHLADQRTRGPKTTGTVEEGRRLGRCTSVSRAKGEDETVKFGKVFGSNVGVLLAELDVGVHLAQRFF